MKNMIILRNSCQTMIVLSLLLLREVGYAGEQNRILGEVNRPGTFEITSDRITLLDTLSLAGDLTICSC